MLATSPCGPRSPGFSLWPWRRHATPVLVLVSLVLAALVSPSKAEAGQVITISDAAVVEGDSGQRNAVFTVSLSLPTTFPVTVIYQTLDGTAMALDGDFIPVSGVLTINGSDQGTISVPVLGDQRMEPDEGFVVELSQSSGAVLQDPIGEGTILNDDFARLSVGDTEVVEGDGGVTSAVFTATLEAPSSEPVTARFATGDGTARVVDGDYRATSGVLRIPPGSLSTTFTVPVNGDVLDEPDETFSVVLGSPMNAVLVDNRGVATILDNDGGPGPGPGPGPSPVVSVGDVEVAEGDEGTTAAVSAVTLSEPSDFTVSVDFSTVDGTATTQNGDYLGATGTVVFQPGVTSGSITVEVVGDEEVEDDETFTVQLSNPDGATLGDEEGTGTILNDDEERVLSTLSISDTSVIEGDSGPGRAVFQVTLTPASTVPVTVDFATVDGTATVADGDYQGRTGQVGFAAGQTIGNIAILTNGDTRQEENETFFVNLSNPTNAQVEDGRGQGTIRNDDLQPGTVTLRVASPVAEGAGTARIEVDLATAGSQAASVRLTTVPGTATPGEDFTPLSRTLTWAPGESGVRVVRLPIVDDGVVEGNETVVLRLSEPTGVVLGRPSTVELVITDDDTALALQVTGEDSLEARVGQALDLVVRVTQGEGGAPGEPVEGAEVRWEVQGDATLPNGATSVSGEDGTARQRVVLGSTAGQVTVVARVGDGEGQVVAFEIRAQGELASLFDDDDDTGGGSVAKALDEACVEAEGELSTLCRYLFALEDPALQRQALEELLPREIAAQVTTSFEAAHAQLENLRARQADLRSRRGSSGSRGTGAGNLSLQVRGEPIRLAAVAGSGWKGSPLKGHSLKGLSFEEMLAPKARQDLPDEPIKGEEGADQEIGTEFSRLGFFVNGNLSVGDRPTTGQEAGFDFDTTGLTVGLDYRLTDRFFFGGALGWLDTGADVVADGGRLDVTGYSLLAYGSYYWKGFYVDVTAGFGNNDYDGARNIDLAVALAGQNRFVAASSTDGRQLSGSVRVGYDRQVGATTLQGFADLSAVDLTVDGYRERGGGPFILSIGEQDATSLRIQGGLEAARAMSFSWGVLRPMVRGAFVRELEDDARPISARFTADRSAIEFVLPTEAPDRNFFNLAAGFTATLVRGRTLFLTYDRDLGRDDLDTETLAVGLRLEL